MTYPHFEPPDPDLLADVCRFTEAQARGVVDRIPNAVFLTAEVWPTSLELEFAAYQIHLFSLGHYLVFTSPALDHRQAHPAPAFGLMLVRTTDWRDIVEIVRPQGFDATGELVVDVQNVVEWLTGVSRDFHMFLVEEISVSRLRGRFLERLPEHRRSALAARIVELCPWLAPTFECQRDARFAGYGDQTHFDLALSAGGGGLEKSPPTPPGPARVPEAEHARLRRLRPATMEAYRCDLE